jgi:hypothetical protein
MASFSITVNIPASDSRKAEAMWGARGAKLAIEGLQQASGQVTSGVMLADGAVNIGSWTYTPTSNNP